MDTENTGITYHDFFHVIKDNPETSECFNWHNKISRSNFTGVNINKKGKIRIQEIKAERERLLKNVKTKWNNQKWDKFWSVVKKVGYIGAIFGIFYTGIQIVEYFLVTNDSEATQPKQEAPTEPILQPDTIYPTIQLPDSALLNIHKTDLRQS